MLTSPSPQNDSSTLPVTSDGARAELVKGKQWWEAADASLYSTDISHEGDYSNSSQTNLFHEYMT